MAVVAEAEVAREVEFDFGYRLEERDIAVRYTYVFLRDKNNAVA